MFIEGLITMKTLHGYISNTTGLTSRLSSALVAEANRFKSDITINVLDESADLKSIMNVMALVVPHGESFTIEITGQDEDAACKRLLDFLKENKMLK